MFHVEQGRRPNDPLSLLTAFAASSPKGTPFSAVTEFPATAEAVPLDRLSPAGERCRVATERGAGGIAAGDDGRGGFRDSKVSS